MKIPHNTFVAFSALAAAVGSGIAFGLALGSFPIGLALGFCFFPIFSASTTGEPTKGKAGPSPDADLRD